MRSILKGGLVTLALLWAASAAAVPMQLSHQGRLFDATGLALDGAHDVEVLLYDAPAGGTVLWSDTFAGVEFDAGYYVLSLGSGAALELADFETDDVYMALTIDAGAEITTRHRLVSVPFAMITDTATNVDGGVVNASEVIVGGNTVIDSSGTRVPCSSPASTATATKMPWAPCDSTICSVCPSSAEPPAGRPSRAPVTRT